MPRNKKPAATPPSENVSWQELRNQKRGTIRDALLEQQALFEERAQRLYAQHDAIAKDPNGDRTKQEKLKAAMKANGVALDGVRDRLAREDFDRD